MITAIKRRTQGGVYTQKTARPNRKLALYDEEGQRHLFPLVQDREVGIGTKFQPIVINSVSFRLGSPTMMTRRLQVRR